MECLSAKTLSGRSFRNSTNRITMSAPLIYPSHSRKFLTRPPNATVHEDVVVHPIPISGSFFELLFSSIHMFDGVVQIVLK